MTKSAIAFVQSAFGRREQMPSRVLNPLPGPASDSTGTAALQHREEHRQVNWLRDVILAARTAWSTSSGSSSA
jgi:hypothetical protein